MENTTTMADETPTKRSRIDAAEVQQITQQITPFKNNNSNINSPFVIHTTTKDISDFLSRLSHMLKEITFQINTKGAKPFLEIRVIHASQTCAVHGKFFAEQIDVLQEEQPLIRVDTKELLCNTSMKIHSSPCQIYYDTKLEKIVLKTVCDRAKMKLYTNVLIPDDDTLPDLDLADENDYSVKLPLFIFKATLKLALQKKMSKIDFFLGSTDDNHLAFGMLFDDNTKSSIFIPVLVVDESNLTFNNEELFTFPSSIEQYKEKLVLSSFSVDYINKFLSSLINTGCKNITLKIHKDDDKPLKMIYNDIIFMLSPLIQEEEE
tara:strand:- start:1529 stop:2488 length:960 start_codon:yes stop_codon:yes gene_type:complete